MRSAAHAFLLAALSGVQALPFSDVKACNGPARMVNSYMPKRDNPSSNQPTYKPTSLIIGYTATSYTSVSADDYEPRYISGMPQPSPRGPSSTLTGVVAPSNHPDGSSMTGLLPPEYWTTTAGASGGWITGVPAPDGNKPTQRPPGYDTSVLPSPDVYTRTQQPTDVPTRWITGVLAPSDANKPTQRPPGYDTSILPTGSWITGVPAPSPIPSPGPSNDDSTEVPSYITGVPAPSPGPNDMTTLPPSGTLTPISPTRTPEVPNCRPEWPTAGHIGTFRAAVIFVDFPDFEANTTVQELWDPIASAPTELYKTMSYGKLDLELVPLLDKFYRMPADSSSYGYARGLTTDSHLKYINDALAAVGPDASFADIDTLYIIPPKFADEISFSTSTGNDITALDGSIITSTITFGQDLFFSWGPKTINHETGHAMGLPDLYPYDGGAIQQYVGGFDMMGVIGGQSPDYMAWHKWRLEWLEESQIVCVLENNGTTEHRISPIEVVDETRDSPKAIAIPVGGTEYVMVEVRSDLGANEGACGTGVLLYTADSALGSGDAPIKVIDTKPESGGCDASHGGELNDAPLKVGEEWDTGKGVVVKVKYQEWNDFIVEVERKA